MSKFASLTAGLLARKGEAEPTATPFAEQLLTRVGPPAADIRALTAMAQAHVHDYVEPGAAAKRPGFRQAAAKPADDLAAVFGTFGRRGAEQVKPSFAPVLVDNVAEQHGENHCGNCSGPSGDDAAKTYHVNLRLKRLRFVKLKLSSALLRRPVQDIVAEALDQWFDKLPSDVLGDCACLRARGD